MFLSRRGGVYHLFFDDESGKRHSRSTHTSTKSEAVEFLRAFNAGEAARRHALKPITLSAFQDSFRTYSHSIHTPQTTRSSLIALRVFSAFVGGDVAMHTITLADCERFLASKSGNVSPYTLRYYFLALRASFERARTWGRVLENPWRKVKKPTTPEIIPGYFTREQFRSLLAVIANRDIARATWEDLGGERERSGGWRELNADGNSQRKSISVR